MYLRLMHHRVNVAKLLMGATLMAAVAIGCTSEVEEEPSTGQTTTPLSVEPTPSPDLDPTATVREAAGRTFSGMPFHVAGGFEILQIVDTIGFSAEGDVDTEHDAMNATATYSGSSEIPPDTQIEMVQIADRFWMRSAAFGVGDAWITFDLDEVDTLNPQLVGLGSGMNDPRTASYFLAGADDMEDDGTEERSGEEWTRYTGTVEFEAAIGAAPPGQQEGMKASLKALSRIGVTAADATVWVDRDGFVRELRYVMTGTDHGMDIEIRMYSQISEIGEPVTIDEPTGEIVDLADVG
jgi:hypothetical protein